MQMAAAMNWDAAHARGPTVRFGLAVRNRCRYRSWRYFCFDPRSDTCEVAGMAQVFRSRSLILVTQQCARPGIGGQLLLFAMNRQTL